MESNPKLPEDSLANFGDVKVSVGGEGCGCLVAIALLFSLSLAACAVL